MADQIGDGGLRGRKQLHLTIFGGRRVLGQPKDFMVNADLPIDDTDLQFLAHPVKPG